jgi:radical SAM protein with 4Fe4S-binding SPASM domain
MISINSASEIAHIDYCQDCDLKFICLGGCKIRNKQLNGSYVIPACNEDFKLIKYYKLIYDI